MINKVQFSFLLFFCFFIQEIKPSFLSANTKKKLGYTALAIVLMVIVGFWFWKKRNLRKIEEKNEQEIFKENEQEIFKELENFSQSLDPENWSSLVSIQKERYPIIFKGIALFNKLKQEENDLLLNVEDTPNKENKKLAQLSEKITTLKNAIRAAYVLPTLILNDRIPVYHIFHTKRLDSSENDSVACGPYAIAFIKAIDQLVKNKKMIWRGSIEELTPKLFQPITEAITFDEMLGQFYDEDLKNRSVGFFNGINYAKSDFEVDATIKNTIMEKLQDPTTKAIHVFLRTGELEQGHWASLSLLREYGSNNQPAIIYLNNSNVVSEDDGTFPAIKKIIADFGNCFPVLGN